MSTRTSIEWTEVTWNPTTGCDRISAGCDNCYALTLAKRLKAMGSAKYQTDGDPRTSGPGFGVALHDGDLSLPLRWRDPRIVFVNSMSDLFHARVPLEFVRRVFSVIADTPQHTYQVLTKRSTRLKKIAGRLEWPPNLWMGVSVEDSSALFRVDDLRTVPAAVRFLSCEPLIGPLDGLSLHGIGWVIAGGESGPGHRPLDSSWVTGIRDRCVESGVPFFFKQWGGKTPKEGGRALDGRIWGQMPALATAPSDRRSLEAVLPDVAARCDILLGPYSTQLMRAAGRMAADSGWLIWNHGGSGDDVEGAHPGHVVSVLTPTSRYAEPFLLRLTGEPGAPRDLCIAHGPGSFGRQVADGTEAIARDLGIRTVRVTPDDQIPPPGISADWDLFSAGVFEQDAELVGKVLRLPTPPRRVCAIAAGVREFGRVVEDPEGTFGIAQWFPGGKNEVALAPSEDDFLSAYADSGGGLPDYPAAQAAAGAVIAVHCARLAGGASRDALWEAAASLETSTLFGGFKIEPCSGTQVKHQTVLVRWTDGEPLPVAPAVRGAN